MYAHTSVFFIAFYVFFSFLAAVIRLPKAIIPLCAATKVSLLRLIFIIRMLVLRACLRDNFFFPIPYAYV